MDKFKKPVIQSENFNRTFQVIEASLKSGKQAGNSVILGHNYIAGVENELQSDFVSITEQLRNYDLIV